MNFTESVLTALMALAANKLRSLLTMLGIIIGVAAVITMIAIGEGSQQAVMDRIQAMGSNLLFVSPGSSRSGGSFVRTSGTSQTMTLEDVTAIVESSPAIIAAVPEVSRTAQVKYENRNWNSRIVGTVPEYETVRNFPVTLGRYFTHAEERAAAKLALIGTAVAENLFVGDNPIGKTVRINGSAFQVIGILESKGQSGWNNPDEQIIVPLKTAQYRLFGIEYLNQITVQVADQNLSDSAFFAIERTLRKKHKLRVDQDNDFSIRNQADLISTFQETQETFTFLLAGIAAVSLLVGGIGIMNIMIVSVTERTKEIGIRKAIGARQRDIMWQFLIESVFMSVFGGILGILVGIGLSYSITAYGNLNTIISPQSIYVSFLFASFVGISFGLYPAWKAAMSNVIDALRYE